MEFRKPALYLLLWLALSAAVWAQAQPTDPDGDFVFHYGRVAGAVLEDLLRRGEMLAAVNDLLVDAASGERRLAGYAEFHAVYDVPATTFLAVVLDFGHYADFMPWIAQSRLVNGLDDPYYQTTYYAGINFFGLKLGYSTIGESRLDYLENGSVGLRSRLVESLDNNLYEHYVSWYVEPVLVAGRSMTYVRYFNRPGIRNPGPGMLTLARLFANGNTRGQVDSMAREASRRQRNAAID